MKSKLIIFREPNHLREAGFGKLPAMLPSTKWANEQFSKFAFQSLVLLVVVVIVPSFAGVLLLSFEPRTFSQLSRNPLINQLDPYDITIPPLLPPTIVFNYKYIFNPECEICYWLLSNLRKVTRLLYMILYKVFICDESKRPHAT